MKQRLVNQEMDVDIFLRMLGMPAQALLLVGGVLIAVMLAGGDPSGIPLRPDLLLCPAAVPQGRSRTHRVDDGYLSPEKSL
jgi:hypothetical protein